MLDIIDEFSGRTLEQVAIESSGHQQDAAGLYQQSLVNQERLLQSRVLDAAYRMEESGIDWQPTVNFLRACVNRDVTGMRDAYRASITKNKGKFGLYTQVLNPMDEGTAADGGNMVPAEYAALVMMTIRSKSHFVSKCTPWRIANGYVGYVPTLATLPSVVWVGENEPITASKPTIGKLTLTLKKTAVIVPFSNELLEDANVDVVAFVARTVGASLALEYDTQIARGTGTPWTGLLGQTTSVWNLGGTTTSGNLNYNDVTWNDMIEMSNVVSAIYQIGSEYYLDQNVFTALLKRQDNQNRYLYGSIANPANQVDGLSYTIDPATGVMRWSFNGWPINVMHGDTSGTTGIMIATYDTADHASTKFGLFGNIKETCYFASKNGLKAAFGTEATVDGTSLFVNDLQAVRYTERVAFGCGLPLQLVAMKTDAA